MRVNAVKFPLIKFYLTDERCVDQPKLSVFLLKHGLTDNVVMSGTKLFCWENAGSFERLPNRGSRNSIGARSVKYVLCQHEMRRLKVPCWNVRKQVMH